MIRKSTTKPVKKMIIKKHIGNSKSNSPTLNNSLGKTTITSKAPNLYYVNKKNTSTEKVHQPVNKAGNLSPNNNLIAANRTAYKKKTISKTGNDIKYKSVLKILKGELSNKRKVIDNNKVIDLKTDTKCYFDCIFKESDVEYNLIIDYIWSEPILDNDNWMVIINSLSYEEIEKILYGVCNNNKQIIIGLLNKINISNNKLDTELLISSIENNCTIKNLLKSENNTMDVINKIIQSKNEEIKILFNNKTPIILHLSFQNQKSSISIVINNIIKEIDISNYADLCKKYFSFSSFKKLYEVNICPLSFINFPKEEGMVKENDLLIKEKVSSSISPKMHKPTPSQSPTSFVSTKEMLINSLTEENKKLKKENEFLKETINKIKDLVNSIEGLLISKQNEILYNENQKFIEINKELSENIGASIEKFSNLHTKLLNIENKVYTFDDSNCDNSQLSEIESENKKNFQVFRTKFSDYFYDISNMPQKYFSKFNLSLAHIDSLKSCLNSFCCFMDEIVDVVLSNIEDKNRFIKNYLEMSFINVYYEKIIFEMFNHSLYENKRMVLNTFLIEHLITLNKEVAKINDKINNDIYSEELDCIQNKLNSFDQNIDDYVNSLSKDQQKQLEKFGKILHLCSQSKEEIGLSQNKSKKNISLNSIKTSENNNNIKNLQNSTSNYNKNSFYGYIKNEESPFMELEEDSQLTEEIFN